MPTFELQASGNGTLSATSRIPTGLESVRFSSLQSELDSYYAKLVEFDSLEPDEVLAAVSSMSARLTGIRAELHRTGSQRANMLRTKEIDPLISSLDFLYKVHSRLHSIKVAEYQMSMGQPA